MGDSTAMTIEFLRARLLSERSVSRTARQRADQLARRVVELEEQLRIVTAQRKRAEKAVSEVLSILEYQGVCDSSEVIDSSSDGGEVCDQREEKEDNFKDEENSVCSGMDRSEDRLSGSELDVSLSQGKSLSWKSRGNNSDSPEKEKLKQTRQRQRRKALISMVESSRKHLSGKSCRKIKRRSTVENEADKPVVLSAHQKAGSTLSDCSNDLLGIDSDASRNEMKEAFTSTSVQCHPESKETNVCDNGSGRDEDMQKVLEHQAQLIGQYQAEENAQREWEEKYNESQVFDAGSSGRGNKTSLAENSAEAKAEGMEFTGENPYLEEAKPRNEMLSNSEEPIAPSSSNDSMPTGQKLKNMNQDRCDSSKDATVLSHGIPPTDRTTIQNESSYYLDNQYDMSIKDMESSNGLAFSIKESLNGTTTGKQTQGLFSDSSDTSRNNASIYPHVEAFVENRSLGSTSSINSSSRLTKWRSSELQSQIYRQLPQEPNNNLGGVMEALHRAKISLQQEISKTPSSQGTLAIASSSEPQLRDIDYENMLGIPIGSAGLFRLPTDSFAQANLSVPKFDASGLRLAAIRPHLEYPTSSYVEAGPIGKQYFDTSMTSGIMYPASSVYSHPTSDLVPERTPSQFPGSYLEVRNEVPTGERYLYGVRSTWPDMRRL